MLSALAALVLPVFSASASISSVLFKIFSKKVYEPRILSQSSKRRAISMQYTDHEWLVAQQVCFPVSPCDGKFGPRRVAKASKFSVATHNARNRESAQACRVKAVRGLSLCYVKPSLNEAKSLLSVLIEQSAYQGFRFAAGATVSPTYLCIAFPKRIFRYSRAVAIYRVYVDVPKGGGLDTCRGIDFPANVRKYFSGQLRRYRRRPLSGDRL